MRASHLIGLFVLLTLLASSPSAFGNGPASNEGCACQQQTLQPRLRPVYVGGYNPYASQFRHAVPTFNYGHFGVRTHPTCSWHTGYYSRYIQWRIYPGSRLRW